jgi:nucleoside-diphosphate-sugar epimerase
MASLRSASRLRRDTHFAPHTALRPAAESNQKACKARRGDMRVGVCFSICPHPKKLRFFAISPQGGGGIMSQMPGKVATSVLLTGASGFLGRQAIGALRQRGFVVHAVTQRAEAAFGLRSDVIWHRADLLDPTARHRLLAEVKPSHLLHLAWYAEPERYWTAVENETWREASLDLLACFATAGGCRALLAGSCAEYDWNRRDLRPWRESDLCRPASAYGRAKHALAQGAANLARQSGVSLAWARIFLLFGPGEHPQRFVRQMIAALVKGEEARCSSGHQIRDFSDTRDAAAALATLLASGVEGPVNIGSGRGVPLGEVAQTLAALAGRRELLRLGAIPDRAGEPNHMVADIARLRNEVGFHHQASLEERLAQCLELERSTFGSQRKL